MQFSWFRVVVHSVRTQLEIRFPVCLHCVFALCGLEIEVESCTRDRLCDKNMWLKHKLLKIRRKRRREHMDSPSALINC